MPDIKGLRYPNGGDVPNIPADIQNLATDTYRKLGRTVADVDALSALSGMVEGDQVYLISHGIMVKYAGAVLGWVNHKNDWIIPSITAGWNVFGTPNYDTVAYLKRYGIVYIRGSVAATTAVMGTTIFTLPVGYRPLKKKIMPVVSTNGGIVRLDIDNTDGSVKPLQGFQGASTAYVALNLSYPQET